MKTEAGKSRKQRRTLKRVSPTCLISFERNRYSVPASFANRPVSLRIYPDRLLVAAEGSYNGRLWPPLPWCSDLKPLAEAPA